MNRYRRCSSSLLLLAGLALCASPARAAEPAPASFITTPCDIEGVPGPVRCGTFEVLEDRAKPNGRKLALKVVVLPATGDPRAPDPLVYFAGGPGDTATGAAGYMATEMRAIRQHRDIVLVDVRGTGGSAALFCPELASPAGVQGFLDDFMPVSAVERCSRELAKDHDLLLYTTNETTDDVAQLLRAMGVAKANLVGVSYGTRAVQVFLRRHPELVRAIVLEGVSPTDERGPLFYARHAQAALDGLFAECAADLACKSAFPNLSQELGQVLQRLDTAPVTTEITDPENGGKIPIRLTRNGFAQTVRYMLYVASTAITIPLYVHEAAQGNFGPIAETAHLFASNLSQMSDGFYLSVMCAEDVSFVEPREVGPAVAGTFLGDFRARQQLAACSVWPTRKFGRDMLEPVHSTVPALLISGERDPVTPVDAANQVASQLPNSLHLVIPDGAHSSNGLVGIECIDQVLSRFLELGTVRGLDTSCMSKITRTPFLLALEKHAEVALSTAELARFAGDYKPVEAGFELKVELVDGKLKATIAGDKPLLLTPVSATRFLIAGAPPGFAITFELENGVTTGLVVEEGPATKYQLKRVAPKP